MVDQRNRLVGAAVDLGRELFGVAAIREDGGALREDDREACGAREPGEPGEPLLARRQIFVLMLVPARDEIPLQTAVLEQRPQRREPLGPLRAFRSGLKALESRGRRGGGGDAAVGIRLG